YPPRSTAITPTATRTGYVLSIARYNEREPLVGRQAVRLGEPQLATRDVRAQDQRHRLVEGVTPAHALPSHAAVRGQHQALHGDVAEGLADRLRDLLRP